MEFADAMYRAWAMFMLIYMFFVVVSAVRWLRTAKASLATIRGVFGSLGMCAGVFSAVLFAWFYAYLSVERELPLHGAKLWICYYVGAGIAIVGMILSLVSYSWLRKSSGVISLVMAFQWWRETAMGVRSGAIVTATMFVALGSLLLVWLSTQSLLSLAKLQFERKDAGA